MQAVLRINSYDPAKLADHADDLDEFDRLHAAQPGYLGTVAVDLGEGRRFVLNLWDSEEHRMAGLATLGPAVERLVNPVLSAPSELIGVGEVVATDLAPAGQDRSPDLGPGVPGQAEAPYGAYQGEYRQFRAASHEIE